VKLSLEQGQLAGYVVRSLGTGLGRGRYAAHFPAYQNCAVDSKLEGEYLVMEERVVICGESMLIGRCLIRSNTWIAVGTLLMDREIPADRIAFERHPAVAAQPVNRRVRERYFRA